MRWAARSQSLPVSGKSAHRSVSRSYIQDRNRLTHRSSALYVGRNEREAGRGREAGHRRAANWQGAGRRGSLLLQPGPLFCPRSRSECPTREWLRR
jgi:hypothetical protein